MTTKDEALAAIAKSRAGYKDFVKQVDADLRVEKAKRLSAHQGTIYHQVAEAWALGASIEDLKRAYGTKDYKTIKNIIDSFSELPSQPDVPTPTAEPQAWFKIERAPLGLEDGLIHVGDASYEVIVLDDGDDIMLLNLGGGDLAELDGQLESDVSSFDPRLEELFGSIRSAMR